MLRFFSRKKASAEEMSFFEHLEVLRFTLIRSIAAVLFFAVIAFVFKEFIFNTVILGPQSPDFISNRFLCKLGSLIGSEAICINQTPLKIINIELAGQFKSHLVISFASGLVLGMPFVLREIWAFVKPALGKKERRGYHFSLFLSSVLFFVGVSFGYYVLSPITIDFLGTYQLDEAIENQIRLGSYIRTLTMLCLATGIAFEMPLIILFLTINRVISAKFLVKYRKHVIIFFFIISAIITPPDVLSQFLVALPLFFLYEICIRIAKRIERRLIKRDL
jgi:sec-independent protein translocase protein TatC